MAVFSKVTQETLQNLLSNFNIGELLYFEGIQAGIEIQITSFIPLKIRMF